MDSHSLAFLLVYVSQKISIPFILSLQVVRHSLTFPQVRPGWDIPLNAVMVSFAITVLLAMINIGSTVAFNAIASLGTAALISSYIVSITCVRIKRWRGQKLPPARWSLGKLGGPINDFSILYLIIVFVFSFFPETAVVNAQTMNWNILIYGFTLIFAVVWFFVRGRKQYDGPVEYVRKDL